MDTHIKPLSISDRTSILLYAEEVRRFFDPRAIEDIAKQCDIVLVRASGPPEREAGFAYIEYTRRPVFIESLVHPEEPLRVWGRSTREPVRSIVINTNAGIPEPEIFWHEYYHLFYSPSGVQGSQRFEHRFSTDRVLHSKEERRADEFAAAVLAPELCMNGPHADATVTDLAEQLNISVRLVERGIQFYLANCTVARIK